MLTTDDLLGLDSYAFKSSPESCSDQSYSADFMDVTSDEDFLTQLSSDLDIPLLLNPGEDEMSMLNSFFDKSPEEILSDVTASPPYNKEEELVREINELQKMDFSQWGPEAFPNLQSQIKVEADSSSSDDSLKSSPPRKIKSPQSDHSIKTSPTRMVNSPQSDIVKNEIEIKSPPLSPKSETSLVINNMGGFTTASSNFIYAQPVQIVSKNQTVPQLPSKHVPIIPKTPYTLSAKTSNQVVVINSDFNMSSPVLTSVNNVTTAPKVVVLENFPTVPMSKVTTVPQIPVTSTQVPVTITQPVTMPSVVISSANSTRKPGSVDHFADQNLLKRQQRKIRNRESASLSRKKKKDYMVSLEDKVKELTDQNERLKAENAQLRERLSQYEDSPPSQGQKGNKNVKKTVVLCAFLLLVGVNLDFIRNPFSTNTQLNVVQRDTPKLRDHHGRSLLWADENDENKTSAFSPLLMCPAAINQTESARLVLELERWIGRPVDSTIKVNEGINKTKVEKPLKQRQKKRKYKLDSPLLSPVYKRDKYRAQNQIKMGGRNELQVFAPTPEQIYSEFFEAINRQDDTFYVVSFTDQHLLLPALHHNKTRRPKMSLIMPSMLPNDTVTKTSLIPLMQIDCEVLDTRLIHVKHTTIPQHLRTYGNTTKKESDSDNNVSNASSSEAKYKEPYKPYFINKNSLEPNERFFDYH